MSSPPIVAAFDVDGTLTAHDCMIPFLRAANGTSRTMLGLLAKSRELMPALVRRDRDRLKALVTRAALTGRRQEELETLGVSFAREVAATGLRPDALVTLRGHQRQGHDLVLVSASYGVYVRPLAGELGIDRDHVIATELVVDSDGRCTGELDGGNCRGDAKVDRLHEWLRTRRGGRDAVELWAYGDSAGDAPMLADADRAVWMT